ncbi:hypothetical protein RJT34_30458 [Clitoria ternatea]|uniref:J domain-containing protein n=1 Tax=Clitoria ternatea TaxID=43366 RepID=A0AAN9ESE6_CLITE
MESVAHSRQTNKVPVAISKKITSSGGNGGFPAKTLYDDVYGGAPKFAGGNSLSPRFEDYGEIFASFHAPRASSIPVLDLPAVDGAEVFFDFRRASFDYAEVFGGFGGLDFWLSYDDLFRDGVSEGEEEAWTPVETDSFSGDFEHFGNIQGMSNGDYLQHVDGSTEFNISYHKVNGMNNEDMLEGKNHISQLRAVPSFTHVFDETAHFHRTDPSLQVVDDVDLDMEFNASKAKRDYLRKMVSHPSNFTSGEHVLSSDLDLHEGYSRNDSHSCESFVTVSDISLRTLPSQVPPPSRPPPVLDAKSEDIGGFSNNERIDTEETLVDSSPPYFDVEVDMNSSAAAMNGVMRRPEAKHRTAKELKERKNGGFESNMKPSYDFKNNEAKVNVNITRFNSLNDETFQTTCDQISGAMKTSATVERRKAKKANLKTQESLEGERLLSTFEEKQIKESRSSQESDRSTGVGTWKEATEFFELVGTEEPGKVFQPINHSHAKSLVQDTRTYEHHKKEREASNAQDECKKVKAIVEGYSLEERKKKSKSGNGACEQGKHIRRSKLSNEERRRRESVKNEGMAEIFELEKSEKTTLAPLHGKAEKKVTKADQSGSLKDMSETQRKELEQVESEKSKEVDKLAPNEIQRGMKQMGNEKTLKEDEQQDLSTKRLNQSLKMRENGKPQIEAFTLGAAEGEKRVKDPAGLERLERSNDACNLDSPEGNMTCERESEIVLEQAKLIQKRKGLKEACEYKETEQESLKSSFKTEEIDEGLKHALGWVENEKGLKEDLELEMNEKRTEAAFELGENEIWERDQGKQNFIEIRDGYGEGNRLKDSGGSIGVHKVLKQAPELEMNGGNDTLRRREIVSPSNEDISNKDSYSKQSENILKDADKNEKDKGLDKALEQMEDTGEGVIMDFTVKASKTWTSESDENPLAAHSFSIHEENIGKFEVCQEPVADQETGKTGTDCKVGEKKLEEIWVENLMDNGRKESSEMPPGEAEHSGAHSGKVEYSVTNAVELGYSGEQTCHEKTKAVHQMEFDPRSQERKIVYERGEKGKFKRHVNTALNSEESRAQTSSSQATKCDDYRKNTVADKPGAEQEAVNIHQKTSQRAHMAHSTRSKEKSVDETPETIDRDAERIRERELEKDRLRKIEEEMERERERQKDRMAVDRVMLEAEREKEREKDRITVDKATSEARDKVNAEARERAERVAFERATAEARQRALAEARERLEKACAEARDKTYADKAAAEARLKAERSAVERATAEARERAMEKVKVERAAFESRERLERSVSDQFSGSFRSDGRQGSSSSDMLDPHWHSFSSSTNARYPYSSLHGASSFNERSEGESAQRCRARLERYRRTAERAAKALEEKNMRDLEAQKEQAERNRLAETLDTEVRRWSSGKEGNLRALLSTLQYILGPDSGWQPIPLTEVITSAAVKKAYRKATLCVHPDKLQQRGASIQHKYICEKVFDLLKEAWNKFNSEER